MEHSDDSKITSIFNPLKSESKDFLPKNMNEFNVLSKKEGLNEYQFENGKFSTKLTKNEKPSDNSSTILEFWPKICVKSEPIDSDNEHDFISNKKDYEHMCKNEFQGILKKEKLEEYNSHCCTKTRKKLKLSDDLSIVYPQFPKICIKEEPLDIVSEDPIYPDDNEYNAEYEDMNITIKPDPTYQANLYTGDGSEQSPLEVGEDQPDNEYAIITDISHCDKTMTPPNHINQTEYSNDNERIPDFSYIDNHSNIIEEENEETLDFICETEDSHQVHEFDNEFEHLRNQLLKAMHQHPDTIHTLLCLAKEQFRLENNNAALRYNNLVLSIEPKNLCALINKGAIFANEGDLLRALEVFDNAMSEYPKSTEAKSYFCQTLKEMAKRARCLSTLKDIKDEENYYITKEKENIFIHPESKEEFKELVHVSSLRSENNVEDFITSQGEMLKELNNFENKIYTELHFNNNGGEEYSNNAIHKKIRLAIIGDSHALFYPRYLFSSQFDPYIFKYQPSILSLNVNNAMDSILRHGTKPDAAVIIMGGNDVASSTTDKDHHIIKALIHTTETLLQYGIIPIIVPIIPRLTNIPLPPDANGHTKIPISPEPYGQTKIPIPSEAYGQTKIPISSEAYDNTKIPIPPVVYDNTKIFTPPEAYNTKIPTPSEACDNTKIPIPPDTYDSTKIPISLEAYNDTKFPTPSEACENTKIPIPPEAYDSTKIPIPPEAYDNTKIHIPPEVYDITKINIPPEAYNDTKIPITPEAYNTKINIPREAYNDTKIPITPEAYNNTKIPIPPEAYDNPKIPIPPEAYNNTEINIPPEVYDNTKLTIPPEAYNIRALYINVALQTALCGMFNFNPVIDYMYHIPDLQQDGVTLTKAEYQNLTQKIIYQYFKTKCRHRQL